MIDEGMLCVKCKEVCTEDPITKNWICPKHGVTQAERQKERNLRFKLSVEQRRQLINDFYQLLKKYNIDEVELNEYGWIVGNTAGEVPQYLFEIKRSK